MRERDVESVCFVLAIFDRRNGIAQRRDLIVELLGREIEFLGFGRSGCEDHCVDRIANDDHAIISLVRMEHLLHLGQRDDVARYRAIAGEAGQRRLGRDLIIGRLGERCANGPHPRRFLGVRFGQALEPGEFDPAALYLTAQGHRLAKQARGFVATAAELARENGLGLGQARPHHQLAGGKDLGQSGSVGRALEEQIDIGPEYIGKTGREIARVRL